MAKPPDQFDRLRPPLRRFARDVRKIWRMLKRLGDTVGDAGLQALLLGQEIWKFGKRYGLLFLLLAGAGAASPLTGGFGVKLLSKSTYALWAPVGVLPALGAVVLYVRWSLPFLDEEGERESRRQRREKRESGLRRRLAQSRTIRFEANWSLRLNRQLAPLEDTVMCADLIATTANSVYARHSSENISIVLLRDKKNKGLQVVLVKGELDDAVEANLCLGKVDPGELDARLIEVLEPLDHWHAQVEFDAGPRRYILLATSGATIPSDVHVEIDETANQLVKQYVMAAQATEARSEEL